MMEATTLSELTGHPASMVMSRCRRKELVVSRYLVIRELERERGYRAAMSTFRMNRTSFYNANRRLSEIENVQHPLWAVRIIDRFNTGLRVMRGEQSLLKGIYEACVKGRELSFGEFVDLTAQLRTQSMGSANALLKPECDAEEEDKD